MTVFWSIFITVMIVSLVASWWLAVDWAMGETAWDPFWLPNHISEDWCEENGINTAGRCIIDILLNIVMLPTMILLMLWMGIQYLVMSLVIVFVWTFRKR